MSYRPTYQLTIGNHRLSQEGNHRLLELDAGAGLDVPVNECRIVLPQFNDMAFAPGAAVSVQLGYGRERKKVFTGELQRVEQNAETLTLIARSAFRRLARSRVDLYFEGATAGEIATALCKQENIMPGNIGVGLRFSYYALGRNRSAYEHLRYLAAQCGFDLYADESDKLVFARAIPTAVHPYSYGVNILSFRFAGKGEAKEKWEVYGESPASFGQGPQGASWLGKKEVKGSAGAGGEVVRHVFAPTIRTLDNAALMAQALQEKHKPRKKGVLKAPGAPEVKIGDTVQINQMPEQQQNGMYKVTGVRHRLNAREGFVSQFNLQEL